MSVSRSVPKRSWGDVSHTGLNALKCPTGDPSSVARCRNYTETVLLTESVRPVFGRNFSGWFPLQQYGDWSFEMPYRGARLLCCLGGAGRGDEVAQVRSRGTC